MKRFDTFGAYMFDLLFAPLKRGKRAANQFFIFFKVIGRIFDGMKKDAFRLRDELNVATASPAMLPVHGQDRDMPRLEGESIENYRTRLSMKGIISEWGGTKIGILYVLTSLGYEQSTIEPFSYQDPKSSPGSAVSTRCCSYAFWFQWCLCLHRCGQLWRLSAPR